MKIEVKDLHKTYTSKEGKCVRAVDGISLTVPENSIYGIIGKSGAGKSSLMRLISLLEKPDAGTVSYAEDRVDNLSEKQLIQERRKTGMIFQNFNLFTSRTAGKNVAYPLEIAGVSKAEIKQRVKEMLSLVGLEDRENAPVSTLSGGQKQRVAIARALSVNPQILFCDEATSALDPQTTKSILSLIRDIQKKMNLTVVMITHQMEVVRDTCDYVAVIDNGKIVEQGKVLEVFENPKQNMTKEFIKNIVHTQSEIENVKWASKTGEYLLNFIGSATEAPLLSKVSKLFDVEFNILSAGIEHVKESQIGTMTVDFSGDEKEIQKAVNWLLENNVKVRRIEG